MPIENDELPLPPTGGGPAPVDFSGEVDASVFGEVPQLNDPVPQGVFHVRLGAYTKKVGDDNGLPYFACQLKVQEEPHVGRVVFDNVFWVDKATLAAAADKNAPNCMEARAIINKRLPRAKALMKAAGFTPSGSFDFEKDFLASNPEFKARVTVSERKDKDAKGKWTIPTGMMQNNVADYLPLARPA